MRVDGGCHPSRLQPHVSGRCLGGCQWWPPPAASTAARVALAAGAGAAAAFAALRERARLRDGRRRRVHLTSRGVNLLQLCD
eukprot:SAG22_NODE_6183_length_889_cov_1.167089_2_plen_81_part_01